MRPCIGFSSHERKAFQWGRGASIVSRFSTKIKTGQSLQEMGQKGPKESKQASCSSNVPGGPYPKSCSTATIQFF